MGFNSTTYKQTTRQQWQDYAAGWHAWAPLLEEWLGAATDRMLELAAVSAGDDVLDVAAGAGGQSIAAARRVGPTGSVLATDLSPAILDHAAQAASAAGVTNVYTRELDGEAIDELSPGSFDAAISRVGLIYFPDRPRALRGIRRALRDGGRFATISYSSAGANEFFSIPVSIIRERAGLPAPAPEQPGPFSLADTELVRSEFTGAGFTDVNVELLDAPVRLPSAAECVRFERESFGALHQMLGSLEPTEQDDVWAEIEQRLEQFETADGFVGPCELVVIGATR